MTAAEVAATLPPMSDAEVQRVASLLLLVPEQTAGTSEGGGRA